MNVWNTVLQVNGPECGYSSGYRDAAADDELLASASRLLRRPIGTAAAAVHERGSASEQTGTR